MVPTILYMFTGKTAMSVHATGDRTLRRALLSGKVKRKFLPHAGAQKWYSVHTASGRKY